MQDEKGNNYVQLLTQWWRKLEGTGVSVPFRSLPILRFWKALFWGVIIENTFFGKHVKTAILPSPLGIEKCTFLFPLSFRELTPLPLTRMSVTVNLWTYCI